MKTVYADPSRSAYSSHSLTGKAWSQAFAALHHRPSPTPSRRRLGWMAHVPARPFKHTCSWSRRGAEVQCCSWVYLPALWSPCAEQARRQDSLLNQAQSPFAPSPSALLARWQPVLSSSIFIPTYMTCAAHAAARALLLHAVQHGQAVRARDSGLPCPYPVPVTKQWQKSRSVPWRPIMYWVFKKCLETSAAPSARGQDCSTVQVTIMHISVSVWVYQEPVESPPFWTPSTSGSHTGQKERMAKIGTAGLLKPAQQVKVRGLSYLSWEY